MKLFKSLTAIALGGLLISVPMSNSLTNTPLESVSAQSSTTQGQTLVALGSSLTDSQAQQTLSLLGANDVSSDKIITVNGSLINEFLADGSTDSTPVYSSVAIEPRGEGYGVQVQILTPANILSVSSKTYQNAAITAGASNVLIKIAAVEPVTGEGALTGVYKLYESTGQQLSSANIELAQKEISLIETIKVETGLDEAVINQIQSLIKQAISEELAVNGELADEAVISLVNQILTEQGVALDSNEAAKFIEFALEYAQSEVALDDETAQQIEDSTTDVWSVESAIDFWEASVLNYVGPEIGTYNRAHWSQYAYEGLSEEAIVLYLASEDGQGSYWNFIRNNSGSAVFFNF